MNEVKPSEPITDNDTIETSDFTQNLGGSEPNHESWVAWPFIMFARTVAFIMGLSFWVVVGGTVWAFKFLRMASVVVLAEFIGSLTEVVPVVRTI